MSELRYILPAPAASGLRSASCALAVLLALSAACAPFTTEPRGPASLVIAGGTSFNMCYGYCRAELVVDSTSLRLVERGWDEQRFPVRERTAELAPEEWRHLRSLADLDALRQVEGVHGCPDCADGGAEWVEIRTARDSVRATFEYGSTLAPIADLQTELRALRRHFP